MENKVVQSNIKLYYVSVWVNENGEYCNVVKEMTVDKIIGDAVYCYTHMENKYTTFSTSEVIDIRDIDVVYDQYPDFFYGYFTDRDDGERLIYNAVVKDLGSKIEYYENKIEYFSNKIWELAERK